LEARLPLAEGGPPTPPGAWVTGPGLRAVAGRLPPDFRVVAAEHWDPQPENLLRLGLSRWERGESDNVWALEPVYLRPSSAEEQWRAAGANLRG
jgi:hypothetical protein